MYGKVMAALQGVRYLTRHEGKVVFHPIEPVEPASIMSAHCTRRSADWCFVVQNMVFERSGSVSKETCFAGGRGRSSTSASTWCAGTCSPPVATS